MMEVAPRMLRGMRAPRRRPFRWLMAAALSSAAVDGTRRSPPTSGRSPAQAGGGANGLVAGATNAFAAASALFRGPDLSGGASAAHAAPCAPHGALAIREAGPADVNAMQRINEAVLPENYSRQFYMQQLADWPGLQLVACAPDLADPDDLAARQAGADGAHLGPVIGYCLGKMEGSRRGHITSIAVLPEHRNRGCATAIMREVTAQMRGRYGAAAVTLNVRKSNVAALHVYTDKLGYATDAIYTRYYQDGEDALHLVLTLEHEDGGTDGDEVETRAEAA
mmetsp:Transcript_4864/g.15059  ORF Transcript_4864/g.15059 Transcript_4864/m.15059 type:complete len:280 (+) Transcript_4864:779-1618(+)